MSGEHAFIVLVIVAGVVLSIGAICLAVVEVARAKHRRDDQDDAEPEN